MRPGAGHPAWCQHAYAPGDDTHTHSATVGAAVLAADTTIELVLVQPSGSRHPGLAMHVVDGATRLSLTLTGAQAWTLAGLFVDATVAHAHAVVDQTDTATDQDTAAAAIARRTGPDRPLWLLDRHPNGRMPRQRAGRPARCIYRPGAGDKHRPARGDG